MTVLQRLPCAKQAVDALDGVNAAEEEKRTRRR